MPGCHLYLGAEFNSANDPRAEKAMSTREKVRQRLLWSAILGMCLLATGLVLLWYSPLGNSGDPVGLATTVTLIALGLLLLLPAKIYIILQLTRSRRDRNS